MWLKQANKALCVAAVMTATNLSGGVHAQGFRVERAPEFTALLDHDRGWTGGDGIFSIPINGDERPGAYTTTDTFFIFSDTYLGQNLPDGSRDPRSIFVNNTMGFRSAGTPEAKPWLLYWAEESDGTPRALFPPSVPGTQPDHWYWMKDGIVLDDTLYVFASRFSEHGLLGIWREGVTLISIPITSRPPFNDHVQTEVPLTLDWDGDRGAIVYGGAILPNTTTAGAPNADGFIYVYGTEEVFPTDDKKIMVARVPEADFANITAWRFYDGTDWVTDIEDAVAITNRGSMEMSVTPLDDGRYIMIFQLDQIKPTIAARVADNPWGPWGPPVSIYDAPEPAARRGIWAYNAKAHPHLSNPGELLISYNLSTWRQDDQWEFGDIYRPRFIKMIFE